MILFSHNSQKYTLTSFIETCFTPNLDFKIISPSPGFSIILVIAIFVDSVSYQLGIKNVPCDLHFNVRNFQMIFTVMECY